MYFQFQVQNTGVSDTFHYSSWSTILCKHLLLADTVKFCLMHLLGISINPILLFYVFLWFHFTLLVPISL